MGLICNEQNSIQIEKDGVIDYPIYKGQKLDGVWKTTPNPNGPAVSPEDGFLHFHVSNQPKRNQWLSVRIYTPFATNHGSFLTFRARANIIQGDEVKFSLPGGVILRFTSGGRKVHWQWWNGGGFVTLAKSSIRVGGGWYEIVMAFSPWSISLFENGDRSFTWKKSVGDELRPKFDIQVLTAGADLSLDVGNILVVPPTYAPGINTPWDFSFSEDKWPASLAMSFRISHGGPKVYFHDGYVRFAAEPLGKRNKWSYMDIHPKAPANSILIYRIRVNKSEGGETKITFPGGNILRLVQNGTVANWQRWDGNFRTLARSSITKGKQNFTIVTLVTTATKICLLENGVVMYQRNYTEGDLWNPSLAVQHLDAGTDVSVDIGSVRTLPSIKSQKLLAIDLQDQLLAYFPLKGSLENVAGNSDSLIPTPSEPAYVKGKFGLAADFSKQNAALTIPQLQISTTSSYTLSTWVMINNFPYSEKLTSIAGALLLDSRGHLNFNFLYNIQNSTEHKMFISSAPLSKNTWHNVVITYSYEESRLVFFVDSQIDTVFYLDELVASASTLVPSYYYIGGFKESDNKPFTILDGAVSDVIFIAQHIHQPTACMLANIDLDPSLELPIIVPLFILVVASVISIGVEYHILNTSPSPPLSLEEVTRRIREKVGQPARTGAQVSRADLGISNDYKILLDIGGEGPLNISGFVTGFEDAININEIVTVQTGGFGPQIGRPIKNIVQVQKWEMNPGYPFSDGFADQIVMIGVPMTQKNVTEIARVIRDRGEINLWLHDNNENLSGMKKLADSVNSHVEEPPEISRFEKNGIPGDTWQVRRRIIARKN